VEVDMAQEREPYNYLYCVKVRCQYRHGNNCTLEECTRKGAEKWPEYFTIHNELADGDKVDA